MKDGAQVAVLVENNRTFLLSAVERAIERLREGGFLVGHLGVVPARLGNHKGASVPLWYLRVFGFYDTGLLVLFSIVEALRRLRAHYGTERRSLSWVGLSRKLGLKCRFITNPNSAESLEFLRASRCDILVILVPYVLFSEVLAIPRIGAINKHAAILPGCRGLFPFVWGTIHGLPLGVTLHKVTARVDAGPLLIQHRFEAGFSPRSMVEFYGHVFRLFPGMVVQAAESLLARPAGMPQPTDAPNPYFGLPSRIHMKAFRAAGGRVIRAADLMQPVGSE